MYQSSPIIITEFFNLGLDGGGGRGGWGYGFGSEIAVDVAQNYGPVSAEDSALGRHIAGATLYERMLCNECGG